MTPRLAEVSWLWRRVFAFAMVLLNGLLLAEIMLRTADPEVLKPIGLGLIVLDGVVALAYLMGATVTDLARLELARRTTTTVTQGAPE